jgi:rhodanese-related sulfurtransferase
MNSAFTEISPDKLMRLIGTPDAPVLVDVCIDADFGLDPRLIPSARRHPFEKIEDLAIDLSGKRVVVICQKGKKLSRGAAALLRAQGTAAESLTGGNFAWRDAGLPLVPVAALPIIPTMTGPGSLWVTRHRPKIDRIACPWLIRRFVDPTARFMFVPPDDVMEVADKFDATPFDIEGCYWSHRGSQCTFDTMIEEFDLSSPALDRLATVIRGADTDAHHLAPQSAGLLALSVGLSRVCKDDAKQLEMAMPIYDALYRWARDGFEEAHDWPADRKS